MAVLHRHAAWLFPLVFVFCEEHEFIQTAACGTPAHKLVHHSHRHKMMWTLERDTEAMQTALTNIIGAYERDFAKHPERKEFPKISIIWKSIPSQLARGNKKFS